VIPEAPAAIARLERLTSVGSTNDVVRSWLAEGVPEIAVAVADEQTAGRGRNGRTWTAPPGAALLLSLGFRPSWLDPDRTWRLAAVVALAMADAAEGVAGLAEGTIRLKWPNDLAIVSGGRNGALIGDATAAEALASRAAPTVLHKLAGILGETEGLGTPDPRVVIGIGINADWPASAFPAGMAGTMTSLREASGGRPIDRDGLLDEFLGRLDTRVAALRGGRFDVAGWAARQVTTGHLVELSTLDGSVATVRALGVDGASGALVVETPGGAVDATGPADRLERHVLAGEVLRVRFPSASVV
jgi:BirA family biotin operon repressor/biotin-[acetyl-CoA-carboxylase] ligase